MVKILQACGISEVKVNAIEDTYQNTKTKFITPDGGTGDWSGAYNVVVNLYSRLSQEWTELGSRWCQ